MSAPRFLCASSDLSLSGLLERGRPAWVLGLGLAALAHLCLSQIPGLHQEERAAKPLSTQFVKRQPRLTKPLELKKRPRPKRRQVQRTMVAVKARERSDQLSGGIEAFRLVRSLPRPEAQVGRGLGIGTASLEPEMLAASVVGDREDKGVVDMSLEMMDVDALDTGQYQAMVVQDPNDKRNIRGFFRLKYAYSESMQRKATGSWEDYNMGALVVLAEAVNRYTDIDVRLEGRILFSSREMMKTPWVYSCVSRPFMLPEQEAALLGRYLVSGGFMLFDSWNEFARGGGVVGTEKRPAMCINSTRTNLKAAMATQGLEHGRDWIFEILSDDHPMYHCYFDFDGVPACIYDPLFVLEGKLEGICLDGRWPVVSCQKVFMQLWGYHYPEFRSERMIQFGVNTIVFALTQEGSITRRLMDTLQ